MNTAVNLLSPQGRLIDSEAMQLEWIPKKEANEPRPARPASLADAANRGSASVVAMNPEQTLSLMREGEDYLKVGDIGAARLAFRRVADAGNADAALELAMTYDPRYLAADGVIGIVGDEAAARIWYQRAKELGSAEANRILAQTFSK
jgi:TPR repeat protein